jgi:hypothetical protein
VRYCHLGVLAGIVRPTQAKLFKAGQYGTSPWLHQQVPFMHALPPSASRWHLGLKARCCPKQHQEKG